METEAKGGLGVTVNVGDREAEPVSLCDSEPVTLNVTELDFVGD